MAEALVQSVDKHLDDWDSQIDFGLNRTLNCTEYLEFVYLSRDRIRLQLEYIRGNFTAEDELYKAQGEDGQSATWALTHVSAAASLVSAHVHIHGVLAGSRQECLSEHLQLLFLMSLRRMQTLLHGELRLLWIVFQGTGELFREGAGKWLAELLDLFEADLRTMESIMGAYRPLTAEEEKEGGASRNASRPGPPLPLHSEREADGIALSTLEVLRRDTFEEWGTNKPLLRALLRYVLPRDGHIADLCAGGGATADFLNSTSILTAYAFDASPNIRQLSRGAVEHAGLHVEPLLLWRNFDMVLCLTAATDFKQDAEAWAQAWRNVEALARQGAVLSCGTGQLRQEVLESAARHAPKLRLDEQLSGNLGDLSGDTLGGLCVFWREQTA